jgi:hypothetical protein
MVLAHSPATKQRHDLTVGAAICFYSEGLSGPSDRPYVAFDSDDLSRRTNQTRRQHRHVADTRADVQNPLTRTHACVTEQSLGVRIKARSLSNQPLLLGIGIPKYVLRSAEPLAVIWAGILPCFDFLSAAPGLLAVTGQFNRELVHVTHGLRRFATDLTIRGEWSTTQKWFSYFRIARQLDEKELCHPGTVKLIVENLEHAICFSACRLDAAAGHMPALRTGATRLGCEVAGQGRRTKMLARRLSRVPVERLQILQAAFIATPESFTFIHAGVTFA